MRDANTDHPLTAPYLPNPGRSPAEFCDHAPVRLTNRPQPLPQTVSDDRDHVPLVWRLVFAAMLVSALFVVGMVLAFVAAPGIRAMMDAAFERGERPAICAGLSAGECGEAMEGR